MGVVFVALDRDRGLDTGIFAGVDVGLAEIAGIGREFLGLGKLFRQWPCPSPTLRNLFVFSVCRLVSRRCHRIGSIARASRTVRYCEGSDSCTPSPRRPGLPTYCAVPSDRSTSNHSMHPTIALTATSAQSVSFRLRHLVEGSPLHTAESSSFPADRPFASGCFSPRLTATQLPSASELWLSPTRTCTVLIRHPRGRTTKPLRGAFN